MSKDRTFQVPPSESASDLKDAAEMLLALPGVTDGTVTELRRVTLLRLSVCAVHEGAFSSTVQLESRFCTGLVFC